MIHQRFEDANTSAPSIFQYGDYRAFLLDVYQFEKGQDPKYSYRLFSKQSGFKSPDHIKLVVSGCRDLNEGEADRVGNACHLEGVDLDYFAVLVKLNQCKDRVHREMYKTILARHTPQMEIPERSSTRAAFFSQAHVVALVQKARLGDLHIDLDVLHKQFKDQISKDKIRETLNVLHTLGLVMKFGKRLELTGEFLLQAPSGL